MNINKIMLNSIYGTRAAGEYPAPRFTNNSRKMAGLPMFRKGKSRNRKYRGYRSPAGEAIRALMEAWNGVYIDTDMVAPSAYDTYMTGGYHRCMKGGKNA